jgi:glutamine amidotransferase
MQIAVVDYGMGNLRSVSKALEHIAPGADVQVTSDPAVIENADRIVFPGQGAMPDCMREMDARALRPALVAAAAHKPFLGICIGLQMLFESSEEGNVPGLGILKGRVRRFSVDATPEVPGQRLKVPHMGWNEVEHAEHPIWSGIPSGSRFYFVHSYYAEPAEDGTGGVTSGFARYGIRFTCAVERANIFAVQFHPEKSQASGLRLLANFVNWVPESKR